MSEVLVYVPDGGPPPGRLRRSQLEIMELGEDSVALTGLTVEDVRGPLFARSADLMSLPRAGGGPFAEPLIDRTARAFGVINVAWHARHLLDIAQSTLGEPVPPLRVRIGVHPEGHKRWGGAHYRLPARTYSERSEPGPVDQHGEVHLGGGRRFLPYRGYKYFHAPAHNLAIVCHEVAHHICRHTADFRLNRLRSPQNQTNRRTAIEEGTCDYFAATILSSPDIYGWHRDHIDPAQQDRRCLAAAWTMADFRGGHETDPHSDGTVWAAALWHARTEVALAGHSPVLVDEMLLRGLAVVGAVSASNRGDDALRIRRHFGHLLAAMLVVPVAGGVPDIVERAMASRGIRPGWSNARAREHATERVRG